jgi:hypothetical protein
VPVEYIPEPIKADITTPAGRAIGGGPYTNNRNRPIQVIIACTHQVNIAGSFCLVQLQVNATGTAWGGWFNTPAIGIIKYSMVVGMVPPNGTFQLLENAAGGVNTVIQWTEVVL